jgi:hypothetical protein
MWYLCSQLIQLKAGIHVKEREELTGTPFLSTQGPCTSVRRLLAHHSSHVYFVHNAHVVFTVQFIFINKVLLGKLCPFVYICFILLRAAFTLQWKN